MQPKQRRRQVKLLSPVNPSQAKSSPLKPESWTTEPNQSLLRSTVATKLLKLPVNHSDRRKNTNKKEGTIKIKTKQGALYLPKD